MRFILPCLPVLAAFALTACGSEPDAPKSVEEVAQEAAKMDMPEPGQYKSTVKVLEFDIPGLPPQAADQMKQMMGGLASQETTYCLTPEDAKLGYEEMVKRSQQGECVFDRFNATASTIDAKMTCKTGEKASATVTMKGRTAAGSMVMDMDMDQASPDVPGGKVHMKMQMTSTRTGDCPKA